MLPGRTTITTSPLIAASAPGCNDSPQTLSRRQSQILELGVVQCSAKELGVVECCAKE